MGLLAARPIGAGHDVTRTVADVLTDHVVFEVECIDRMYLNAYVPGLQYAPGLVAYVHHQLDLPIASTAPLSRISDRFGAAMHRFAGDRGVPWVDFAKRQRKDDVMHAYLAAFTGEEGVLFIGRAQEKTSLFRTEKRRNADGAAYPWIVKTTGAHHQHRPAPRHTAHPHPHPNSAARPGPAHRPQPTRPDRTTYRGTHLPAQPRPTHPAGRIRRMTPNLTRSNRLRRS